MNQGLTIKGVLKLIVCSAYLWISGSNLQQISSCCSVFQELQLLEIQHLVLLRHWSTQVQPQPLESLQAAVPTNLTRLCPTLQTFHAPMQLLSSHGIFQFHQTEKWRLWGVHLFAKYSNFLHFLYFQAMPTCFH